jgi:hypothetical protein
MVESKEDPRYPYTYAADYLRAVAGYNNTGTKISRADASRLCRAITDIAGIGNEWLAQQLADYYLSHQDDITEKSVAEFQRTIK